MKKRRIPNINHTKTAYPFERTGPQITSLLSLSLLVFGGLIIGEFIGAVIISVVYGVSMESLTSILADPGAHSTTKNYLLILSLARDIFGFIGAPVLYQTMVAKEQPFSLFHGKNLKLFPLLTVIFIALCMMLPHSIVVQWNMQWDYSGLSPAFEQWARAKENELQGFTNSLTTFNGLGDLLPVFFVVSIVAGIAEEFVFRGLVQPLLTKSTHNHHLAIWLTAAVFSAIHLEFYGFVPRMLLGALYGYLFFWSGNIMYSIMAHVVNNGFIVLMTYLYQQKVIPFHLDAKETLPLSVIIFTALVGIALIYYFKHFFSRSINSTD